ncbi:MAG: hypothetical protein ABIC82_03110 [bacterium]
MQAKQTVVQEAIKNSDYSTWIEAVGKDCPMAQKITQDNFLKFAEAQTKMQEARQIMKELGLEKDGFERNGFRNFMRKEERGVQSQAAQPQQ